jgi:uncharacterized membrane protein YczE
MKKSQYHTPVSLGEKIAWLLISIVFIGWAVSVYLRVHGIWEGF